MINKDKVIALVEERINELGNGLYIVELTISSANSIHVEIDNAELIQLNNVGFTYRKKALDIGDQSTNEEVYPYSC